MNNEWIIPVIAILSVIYIGLKFIQPSKRDYGDEEDNETFKCSLCNNKVDEEDTAECEECSEVYCQDCCSSFDSACICDACIIKKGKELTDTKYIKEKEAVMKEEVVTEEITNYLKEKESVTPVEQKPIETEKKQEQLFKRL